MTSKPWASATSRGGVVARVVDEQRAVGGVDRDLGRHVGDRARGLVGRQHERDDGRPAAVAQQRLPARGWTSMRLARITRSSWSARLSEAPSGSASASRSTGLRARAPGARPGPTTQRRAENERTSGTSVEITRPRAASSSRSVARGSRHAWAGTKPHQRRPAMRAVTDEGSGVTTHSTPPGRSSPAQRSTAATGSSRCSMTSASTTTSKPSRSTKASTGCSRTSRPSASRAWRAAERESSRPTVS